VSAAGALTALAVALTVGATLLLRLPARWLLGWRLPAGAPVAPARRLLALAGGVAARARSGWGPVVVGLVAAPWLVSSPVSALLLATAAGAGAFGLSRLARARTARAAADLAGRLVGALELLAAELRSGVLPAAALAGAAADVPELRPAADVAGRGGDVAAALRSLAGRPGAADLAAVAAAWQVAERSGAPVAAVLEQVVEAVRSDQELAREVRTECASAQATARLLAVLPLLGLGLGSGLGGDPVRVLTSTLPGAVCLAAGTALALAGLAWVDAITARAARAAP
jgi:tight adherence protein B